jgi:hypothetical protein
MSNTTELTTPKESLVESYQQTAPNIPNVCQPGDKECTARWIQAFTDCE